MTEHIPVLIGTHDEQGLRTHSTPGEVCAACSDPELGKWVPASFCPLAAARLDSIGDSR